ncbi:MAG: TetR/AcrR family transcriptional regulator [Gemmataceae bacterium]
MARQRRQQIVDAALEIIATEGIHKLSLGNIERRVKMARGHLTYYFATKEAILIAVLDQMVARMMAEAKTTDGAFAGGRNLPELIRRRLRLNLSPPTPDRQAFLSVIHTFLAQMSYRDDVREKLAHQNESLRQRIAADYVQHHSGTPPVQPVIFASLLMGVMHGLSGQLAVDPHAFDREAMFEAVLAFLAPSLTHSGPLS